MTTPSSDNIPVVDLPERVRRHSWNFEHSIPACESADGNNRTEKTCVYCRLVKVTVHPSDGSFPWREWRDRNGKRIWGQKTPECEVSRP